MKRLPVKRESRLSLVFSLLLIVVSVLVATFVQLPGDTLLWRELQNTGHTLLSGVIALATLSMLRGVSPLLNNRPIISYALAVVASFSFGVLIEFGQLLTERDPSVLDLLRDLTGIMVALGLYACVDQAMKVYWLRRHNNLRTGVIVFSMCMLVAGLLPMLRLSIAYVQRDLAYPVLLDFGDGWARPFIQLRQADLTEVSAPAPWRSATDHKLVKLTLKPSEYPGISVIEPYPDWSGFDVLTLEVLYTDAEAFDLVLRVNDRLHNDDFTDRFNQRLRVVTGENRFIIPLSTIQHAPKDRQMNMKQIARVTLFVTAPAAALNFYPVVLSLE